MYAGDIPGIATTITVTATIRISRNSLPFIAGEWWLSGNWARNRKRSAKNKVAAALSALLELEQVTQKDMTRYTYAIPSPPIQSARFPSLT